MKKTLLFKKKPSNLFMLLVCCFCFNISYGQTNLVLNGTADEYTSEPNDNADAFDMTPSSKIIDNTGTEVDSPFRALWNNSALDSWLDTNCGDNSELPASTSDGNYVNGEKTRGYKLNEACRRLYQVVEVVQGNEYTFSIESRSEAENVPSEIFILNTEIESEATLSSTSTDVTAYMEITNDFNASKSSATENNFTTTTFSFTATSNKIVIYVRAPLAINSENEVFYDNISLIGGTVTPPPPTGENLVLNGTADEYTSEPNDNADAFDMTPSSKIIDNTGTEVDSPFRALWNNSALDSWLDTNCGDNSELPASTSDGNYVNGEKTRGYKLNEACRRLYQVVEVVQGNEYTFSIESRSEAENVPSEIFILNTEIESEATLSSTSTDVTAYMEITNDFNASKSSATENNFTTTTFSFTATSNKIVIYVRAPLAINSENEVFYDNISLVASAAASVDKVFASKVSIYPNPAKDFLIISSDVTINKVEVYNLLGTKVISTSKLNNNNLDISNLANGVYMMKLTSGASIASKKFIKK